MGPAAVAAAAAAASPHPPPALRALAADQEELEGTSSALERSRSHRVPPRRSTYSSCGRRMHRCRHRGPFAASSPKFTTTPTACHLPAHARFVHEPRSPSTPTPFDASISPLSRARADARDGWMQQRVHCCDDADVDVLFRQPGGPIAIWRCSCHIPNGVSETLHYDSSS